MHVIMRFELERALLRGAMRVEELPAAWKRRMHELLAVSVPDDRRGCLQDVHWSSLAIGYFPTYLLGAIMAAQLAHHMRTEMPDLDAKVQAGDFTPIRQWLNERVHRHGSVPRSMDDLLQRAVGEPLKTEYFLACAPRGCQPRRRRDAGGRSGLRAELARECLRLTSTHRPSSAPPRLHADLTDKYTDLYKL